MIQVVDGDLAKVMSWYDNEWGYSRQLVCEALSSPVLALVRSQWSDVFVEAMSPTNQVQLSECPEPFRLKENHVRRRVGPQKTGNPVSSGNIRDMAIGLPLASLDITLIETLERLCQPSAGI